MTVAAGIQRRLGSRLSLRLVERNRLVFRHAWAFLVTGFLEPMFFLLGIGFGLGRAIGDVALPNGELVPYPVFVAPALIAAAVMSGATYDAHNFFFRLRYEKSYEGILSTPLTVADVSLGETIWCLVRGALYAVGFLVVMYLLGLIRSPWGLLALPAAMLVAFTFGATGLAIVTYMTRRQHLDLFPAITLPLFLFSGTFFPISLYPEPLRALVELSPLYRGVDLVRGLTTGVVGWIQVVDVIYLVVMSVLLLALASRRLRRTMLK